eukprot:6488390-Amphidinium_carterae.1
MYTFRVGHAIAGFLTSPSSSFMYFTCSGMNANATVGTALLMPFLATKATHMNGATFRSCAATSPSGNAHGDR